MQSCATIYKAPVLESAKVSHKSIAILPIDVIIEAGRLPKKATDAYIKEQEEKRKEQTIQLNSYFQKNVFTKILKHQEKNESSITILK